MANIVKEKPKNYVSDIPKEIFERFLGALKEQGVSSEIIQRLEKNLIDEQDTSISGLKKALFRNDLEE